MSYPDSFRQELSCYPLGTKSTLNMATGFDLRAPGVLCSPTVSFTTCHTLWTPQITQLS